MDLLELFPQSYHAKIVEDIGRSTPGRLIRERDLIVSSALDGQLVERDLRSLFDLCLEYEDAECTDPGDKIVTLLQRCCACGLCSVTGRSLRETSAP